MNRGDRQRPLFETQGRGPLEARSRRPLLAMFLLLDPREQAVAIRKLARAGWNDRELARLTGVHVERIRQVLSQPPGSDPP